jgi:CRISPR/Cas system-associated protein Cas10 (large subunit of type III CRISPR-Cas system)
VLNLRKFVDVQTPFNHYLKIVGTPMLKIKVGISIKSHFYPKLRKIRKALENNEQWMKLFFLAYLSNKKPRKNKKTTSPE